MKLAGKVGLVFNGGGVLGLGHIGALSRISEVGAWNQFTHYGGASIGSVVAAAKACGADYEYLDNLIRNLNIKQFLDETEYDLNIVDAGRLIMKYGWYKGEAMSNWYKKIVNDLTGSPDTTMSEAHERFGTYLMMTAYRANDEKTVYLDHILYPNLPLWLGMRWSSTYPFLFAADICSPKDMAHYTAGRVTPKYDIVFVDGGILNNYPMDWIERMIGEDAVLGLRLSSPGDGPNDCEECDIPDLPKNLLRYALGMGRSTRAQALKIHVSKNSWDRTIRINVGTLKSTDFDISKESQEWVWQSGRDGFDEFMNKQ